MTGIGLDYLFGRVGLVERRVRALIAHRRRDDPNPEDPFRGLYLSDEAVDRLLRPARPPPPPLSSAERDRTERVGDAAERAGQPSRLRQLARSANLTDLDMEFLVAALAPDLDSRFERLYGYLDDDVTRRRATIGLVLELAGVPAASAAARARLAPGGPLLDHRLVVLDDASGPFLTRSLRVPDRVTFHLLGDDTCDPALADGAVPAELVRRPGRRPARRGARPGRAAGVPARPRPRSDVAAAARRCGVPADRFWVLTSAGPRPPGRQAGPDRRPGALLRGAGLVAGPVDGLVGPSATGLFLTAVRQLTELPVPVLLYGEATWGPAVEPAGSPAGLKRQSSAPPTGSRIWHGELDGLPTSARHLGIRRWGRIRSPAPSGPRGCPAWPGAERQVGPRAARGPASRTRRAWSGWPGGSSPPSAGPTWCCPPR